jgi:hypothetical protein
MKLGRNAPCPCGSGLKFKRCCSGRKPLTHALVMDMGRVVPVDSVGVDWDGHLQIYHEGKELRPERVWVNEAYERSKSPKILSRIYLGEGSYSLEGSMGLERFTSILIIDTNTRKTESEIVSVSGLIVCRVDQGVSEFQVHWVEAGAFAFTGVDEKCENFAWLMLQRMIVSSPDYSLDHRYAIITDADLGQLNAYNAREVPIYADSLLEENVSLFYASADVGRSVFNRLIKRADRKATEMAARLASGGWPNRPSPSSLPVVLNGPCTRFGVLAHPIANPPRGWFRLGVDVGLQFA